MKRLRAVLTMLMMLALATGGVWARADAALLMEEPYGLFGGINPTGHAAIYLNNVCAETPTRLRVEIVRHEHCAEMRAPIVPPLKHEHRAEAAVTDQQGGMLAPRAVEQGPAGGTMRDAHEPRPRETGERGDREQRGEDGKHAASGHRQGRQPGCRSRRQRDRARRRDDRARRPVVKRDGRRGFHR